MTDVFINGRPLETFGAGFRVALPLGGWIDAPGREFARGAAIGMAGSWITATQATPRQLVVTVEPVLASVSARRAALAQLYMQLQGVVDIALSDDPYRYCRGLLRQGAGGAYSAGALAVADTVVEMVFDTEDPNYYSTVPSTMAVPPSTRVTIPQGTAAFGGALELTGAGSDPCTVILRDRAGNELQRVTITAAWANTAVVVIDSDWATIRKYTAGVPENFADEIGVTESPRFVLDPLYGPCTVEYTGAADGLYIWQKAEMT